MAETFYRQLDEAVFVPTEHTAGPWSPDSQHLGPPSALLARSLEALPSDRPSMLARVTVEILGPVPLSELTVTAEILRPGRSVELTRAELAAGGKRVATATAWRVARSDSTLEVAGGATPLTPVDQAPEVGRPTGWEPGYIDAMEWRSIHGMLGEPGPAAAWVRQQVGLVPGEEPSPVQRLLTVADSGNGLSNRLDITRWLFINTELTVHIQREPSGEWIGLDANTIIGPSGVGTASSTLHDQQGQVATGAQALLVAPREGS